MGRKSKSKGYTYEKEIEEVGTELGYETSKRAWGSNGLSLGWTCTVDNVWFGNPELPDVTIQAKRKKKLPSWATQVCGTTGSTVLLGGHCFLMPLDTFIEALNGYVPMTIHVEREKDLPKWAKAALHGEHDIVVMREDYGDHIVMIDVEGSMARKLFSTG